jgi:transcription antitermination factor NusG
LEAIPHWYAIQTRSRCEKTVNSALRAKGIHTYLPLLREVHQWKDRKQIVDVPLFSGYVIARFVDSPRDRLAVVQTPGVSRILSDGDTITPIEESEITSVQQLVESREHTPYPHLREGVRIRVRRGPLCGVEGFLVRLKTSLRIVISIHLIGQSVAAEIDADDVVLIG